MAVVAAVVAAVAVAAAGAVAVAVAAVAVAECSETWIPWRLKEASPSPSARVRSAKLLGERPRLAAVSSPAELSAACSEWASPAPDLLSPAGRQQ